MDTLIALLEQIAQQYEAQGNTKAAEEIKILATTGHNMSLIHKDLENLVLNTCKDNAACYKSYYSKIMPAPSGYDATYSPFPSNVTYYEATGLSNIGFGISASATVPSNCGKIVEFYNKTLNQIKNDSSISDGVKGIIKELTWDIGTVAQKWMTDLTYFLDPTALNYEFDPLTGKQTTKQFSSDTTYASVYNDIQNINAPELTHVDSGLICASGGYSDSGTSCH